jgi:hypothetical protein
MHQALILLILNYVKRFPTNNFYTVGNYKMLIFEFGTKWEVPIILQNQKRFKTITAKRKR